MQQPFQIAGDHWRPDLAGKERPATSRGGPWMAGRGEAKDVYLDDQSDV
jgi:hypothetical protein